MKDYAKMEKQNLVRLSAKAVNVTRKNFRSILNNSVDEGLIYVSKRCLLFFIYFTRQLLGIMALNVSIDLS